MQSCSSREQDEKSPLGCSGTGLWLLSAGNLGTPFHCNYIKNGSQGQVLGYSQSRQWEACCVVGNEACLELRLLMVLPGIQLGHIVWHGDTPLATCPFSCDFHMGDFEGLFKSPQSSCFRAAPAAVGKHLDGSIPLKAGRLEEGSLQP